MLAQKNAGSIEGTVIDRTTHQPLPGANLVILESQMGVASDLEGNFVIVNIPVGIYKIEATMLGYRPEVRTEIVISTNRVTRIVYELSLTSLKLDEVVVTPGYFKQDDDKPVSAKTLTSQEIRFSPGTVGDIFRVIKSMPGVSVMGSIAYTYSISKRRDAEYLPEYYSEFDQRHIITLVSGYKLTDKWEVGVKFQYASGSPYTPVIGADQKDGIWYVLDGNKNSARYPDYHKLDIRIDRRFHFSKWTLTAYMDIWNVYNSENIFSYNYEVDNSSVITKESLSDFPLIPIIGCSAQF